VSGVVWPSVSDQDLTASGAFAREFCMAPADWHFVDRDAAQRAFVLFDKGDK